MKNTPSATASSATGRSAGERAHLADARDELRERDPRARGDGAALAARQLREGGHARRAARPPGARSAARSPIARLQAGREVPDRLHAPLGERQHADRAHQVRAPDLREQRVARGNHERGQRAHAQPVADQEREARAARAPRRARGPRSAPRRPGAVRSAARGGRPDRRSRRRTGSAASRGAGSTSARARASRRPRAAPGSRARAGSRPRDRTTGTSSRRRRCTRPARWARRPRSRHAFPLLALWHAFAMTTDVSDLDESYGRTTARFYDAAYERSPQVAATPTSTARSRARAAGPVLELGCGTGRVLLQIAADGFPCTGLDASRHMLDALRAKSTFPNLRLVHAPMQRFELGRRALRADLLGVPRVPAHVHRRGSARVPGLRAAPPRARRAARVRRVRAAPRAHGAARGAREPSTSASSTTASRWCATRRVSRDPAGAAPRPSASATSGARGGKVVGERARDLPDALVLALRARASAGARRLRATSRSTATTTAGRSAPTRPAFVRGRARLGARLHDDAAEHRVALDAQDRRIVVVLVVRRAGRAGRARRRSRGRAARRGSGARGRRRRAARPSRAAAEATSSTSRSAGTRISTEPNTAETSSVVTPGASRAWVKSSFALPNQARTSISSAGSHSPLRASDGEDRRDGLRLRADRRARGRARGRPSRCAILTQRASCGAQTRRAQHGRPRAGRSPGDRRTMLPRLAILSLLLRASPRRCAPARRSSTPRTRRPSTRSASRSRATCRRSISRRTRWRSSRRA